MEMFAAVNVYEQGNFSEEAYSGRAGGNSHKEAERRRRKRINGHIATLKSILPNAVKKDKASLLAEAVRRVTELNRVAAELSETEASLNLYFPSETDKLKVFRCDDANGDNSGLVKATLCCEDRPEIVVDLIQALKSVEAKVVRAEMSTMGGRMMSGLWVRLLDGGDIGVAALRRALKMVVDKSSYSVPVSKRTRYLPSS